MSEFKNRVSNYPNRRQLDVLGVVKDSEGSIIELLVDIKRKDSQDNNVEGNISVGGTKLTAENVKQYVEYLIAEHLECDDNELETYSVDKKEFYWIQNNLLPQDRSVFLGDGPVYLKLITNSQLDCSEVKALRTGTSAATIIFKAKTPSISAENYTKVTNSYVIEVYSDMKMQKKVGTETITIHFLYLNENGSLNGLCRLLNEALYVSKTHPGVIQFESTVDFPIRVKDLDNNSLFDVSIQNNDTKKVTVSVQARSDNNLTNSISLFKNFEVIDPKSGLVLNTYRITLNYDPNSTNPLD